MPPRWQLVVDCADPAALVRFWSLALGYVPARPPRAFATWNDYYRSVGVPEDELDPDGDGTDSIVDPDGLLPRIWFQLVPEAKTGKNRLHVDVQASGGRDVPTSQRRERVEAMVERLLAAGATRLGRVPAEDPDHYAVAMLDPEGNEFDVN